MKMVEIAYVSEMKEIEKLQARLERAEATLAKKQAAAEKMGVANMTNDEHREWLAGCETSGCYLANKADIKKNGAWFDLHLAISRLEEVKASIERAEARLEKKLAAVVEYREQAAKVADLKDRERLMELEFEEEKKEWAKDGIELVGRYYGRTPAGKKFCIDRNNGFTERSWHCFTLYIDGETIFTSGEFWRAYAVIKNN